MLLCIAWKRQQESARYRPLYVTTWIRVAAEGGKKFCTSIFSLYLFFLILFYSFCFFTCFFPHLHQILPLSYHNPSGIHTGDHREIHLSAELFGRFAAGSCLTFFSLISVRQIVLPHSDYHKSCLISSHKHGTILSLSCGGNS